MMHIQCICGGNHPACVNSDDEDRYKMHSLELTQDHDKVSCSRCLRVISWSEDED